MKKTSGIRNRWLLNNVSIMVLIVLAAVAVTAIAISSIYYNMMRSGLEAKLKTNTDFFENFVSASDEDFYNSIYQFTQDFDEKDRLELEFINSDGEILTSSFGLASGTRPQTEDVVQAIETMEISTFSGRDPATGERIMAVSGPVAISAGKVTAVMRYVTSLRVADRQTAIIVGCAVALGAVMILLVFITGLFFLRSIVAPVGEITETTERIASGGYGVQIQKKFAQGNDEIGQLARAINNLSLQVSQTEKMQSEFLSSVSHELRTPLTAISGWGETLLGSENMDSEETRRGIVTMLRETKRLTSLVEELLEFSRIQDGRFKLNVVEADLRSVFEDTIFMYGNRLSQDGIELEYEETDEDIPEISCDPERMKQVFLNILDNAAKYGGEGGRIFCAIHDLGAEVAVTIRDYGPGIPEEELPLVKKKFYKGSSNTRGSGIGLAVCEEIVTMHGGQLDIANAADGEGGCEVTIRLPI